MSTVSMNQGEATDSRGSESTFLTSIRARGIDVARQGLADGSEALVFRPERPCACIVLYHGGGNDRLYGFWYLVEELVDSGIAVVTVDLPGHGVGGVDRFSVDRTRQRMDAMTRHAAEVADHVILLGQSMGGAFALDQLARGTAAEAVIAVSVPARIEVGYRSILELSAVFEPEAWRVLRYVPAHLAWPAFGPFGRERFPIRLDSDETYVTVFRRTLGELNLIERLSSTLYRQPVLLVHGKRDGVAPYSGMIEFRAAMGDQASLLSVYGANHFDLLLRRSVVTAIGDWVKRVVSGS